MASERSRLLRLAKRVVARMRNTLLSMIFCAWADIAYEASRLRKAEAEARELAEAQEEAIRKAEAAKAQKREQEEMLLRQLEVVGARWFASMAEQESSRIDGLEAVSYTHLTLPTILLV